MHVLAQTTPDYLWRPSPSVTLGRRASPDGGDWLEVKAQRMSWHSMIFGTSGTSMCLTAGLFVHGSHIYFTGSFNDNRMCLTEAK